MKDLFNRVDSKKKVRRKVVITLTDTRIKIAVSVFQFSFVIYMRIKKEVEFVTDKFIRDAIINKDAAMIEKVINKYSNKIEEICFPLFFYT